MKQYQIINGTSYSTETPANVIHILEWARAQKERIRVFYGDRTTGRDWMEVFDTIGYIGRSGGQVKRPFLIKTSRSTGGGVVLDDCIVKITYSGRVLYQHASYYLPKLKVKSMANGKYQLIAEGSTAAELANVPYHAAMNELEFLKGKTNRHIYK